MRFVCETTADRGKYYPNHFIFALHQHARQMKNLLFTLSICFFLIEAKSQNAGINTDGSTPETGVMLDVKGTNPISTTATQNVFQVKSFNTTGNELKMRMVLGTHTTAGSRYGALEVYEAGAASYRALALQPSGGYVGIATTNPASLLDILHPTGVPTSGAFRVSRAIGQSTYISPIYGGGPFYSYIGTLSSAVETNNITLHTTGNVTFDNGSVGIGVSPPTTKLDVQGTSGNTIKIVDGNQGANKVLTSDAAGVGSWQSLSAIGGTCFQNSYAYTANNTWTCPAGVTKAFVEVWGAGGGGYQAGAAGERYGGGGGGAYAAGYVTVVPATNYAVVVGTGGAPNAAGGSSSFASPVLVAGGGAAGAVYNPGAGGTASATLAGATLISGGRGNDYDFFFDPSGILGGDGRWYGKGGQAGGNGGDGGANNFNGNSPGGGGGPWGSGANGMVIIRW